MTWNSIKINIMCILRELAIGYRLMVGRQILILDVEVRALVPEPIPSGYYPIPGNYKDLLPPCDEQPSQYIKLKEL